MHETVVRSHVTQKLGQISKIWSVQNLDFVVSESVVTCQLTLKMAECITHRPLPTYQISSESEKLFVDGHLTHLRIRPKEVTNE